jgi:hypothetical protein
MILIDVSYQFPINIGPTYSFLPQGNPDPNADWILNHILTCLTNANRMITMKKAYALLGGWEIWLQVEVALWLQANVANTTSVEREKPIYNSPHSDIDLWITARTPTWFTNGFTSIPGKFITDAGKLRNFLKLNFAQDANLSVYALAITGDPRDIAWKVALAGGTASQNKEAFPTPYRPTIRWCYIYRNYPGDLREDFVRVTNLITQGQNPTFENLYLIWYKKP